MINHLIHQQQIAPCRVFSRDISWGHNQNFELRIYVIMSTVYSNFIQIRLAKLCGASPIVWRANRSVGPNYHHRCLPGMIHLSHDRGVRVEWYTTVDPINL